MQKYKEKELCSILAFNCQKLLIYYLVIVAEQTGTEGEKRKKM